MYELPQPHTTPQTPRFDSIKCVWCVASCAPPAFTLAKVINYHSFSARNSIRHRLPHLRLRRGTAQTVLAQEPGRFRKRRLSGATGASNNWASTETCCAVAIWP